MYAAHMLHDTYVCTCSGTMVEVYKMVYGPWAVPPRPKQSKTLRSLETARDVFLKNLRMSKDWGAGHKRLLRPNGSGTDAKHLKAHEALKLFQTKLFAVVASWPRDDGQVPNSLASIVRKLTIIIRECTADSIEVQVRLRV